MNVKMLVASVSTPKAPMKATLADGTEVSAEVTIVEVGLVDEEKLHGGCTLRFATPEEKAAATALFVQGEFVTLTFS